MVVGLLHDEVRQLILLTADFDGLGTFEVECPLPQKKRIPVDISFSFPEGIALYAGVGQAGSGILIIGQH